MLVLMPTDAAPHALRAHSSHSKTNTHVKYLLRYNLSHIYNISYMDNISYRYKIIIKDIYTYQMYMTGLYNKNKNSSSSGPRYELASKSPWCKPDSGIYRIIPVQYTQYRYSVHQQTTAKCVCVPHEG